MVTKLWFLIIFSQKVFYIQIPIFHEQKCCIVAAQQLASPNHTYHRHSELQQFNPQTTHLYPNRKSSLYERPNQMHDIFLPWEHLSQVDEQTTHPHNHNLIFTTISWFLRLYACEKVPCCLEFLLLLKNKA